MNKLSIALAALTISGALTGPAAALNRDDLAAIRAYVEAGDAAALRQFLSENPEVLDGSPLANALSDFMASQRGGFLQAIGFRSPFSPDLLDMVEKTKRDASLY